MHVLSHTEYTTAPIFYAQYVYKQKLSRLHIVVELVEHPWGSFVVHFLLTLMILVCQLLFVTMGSRLAAFIYTLFYESWFMTRGNDYSPQE